MIDPALRFSVFAFCSLSKKRRAEPANQAMALKPSIRLTNVNPLARAISLGDKTVKSIKVGRNAI